MCGIAGIVPLDPSGAARTDEVRSMCDTIVHRGPDDEGVEVLEGVGIGMRRLSIIDLSGGHQPIATGDGQVRVVFNGEIYNFRELREELEKAGHRFRTRSDTEVLVHGWVEWGEALPTRLNGMFAFAIHDRRKQRVFLARDHLGIKPLYLARTKDRLLFGSEIKTLLCTGDVRRELDTDALHAFLTWEYVPAPQTLLSTVEKLPPGHSIEVDLARQQVSAPQAFWHLADVATPAAPGSADWEDLVEEQVRRSVDAQLVSDVPLGAFLSGGVDSSLVTAFMGRGARTFSIGFEDASYSELEWARCVAEHLRVDHRDEILEPDVVELFDRLMVHMDDPIGDFSIFPTFMVSEMARRDVTVSLSGDGGDEIFAGYDSYVAQHHAGRYERVPRWLRRSLVEPLARALPPQEVKKGLINKVKRFVEGTELPADLGHARWRLFLSDAGRARLFTPEAAAVRGRHPYEHVRAAYREAEAYGPVTRGLYADVKTYLPDNILVKADRMSMATSLEVRVPLLDKDLVELAFRIPDGAKLDRGESKQVLKRVAARHVPRECVYRAKEGFSIPIKNWLGGRFRPLMEDLLSPERIADEGLFAPAEVERLKREHLANRANHSHVLWSMMVFQAWRSRWLDEDTG